MKSLSCVQLITTPWTAAYQAPPSMGFSRQEYWSGAIAFSDTYATSTHFPCFLQNQSNCKTVLYLRDPPKGHHSPSSNGYHGHAVSHRKTRYVFFKPWGSNLSQFFRTQFKGVRLELLAPICKREKSDQGHFSTRGVPPCSRWGCRQTLHQKLFLPGRT